MSNEWIVLREGTWLYAGETICDIRILKHGWCYGSGDYEDEPEVQDDRQGEFYYIEFGVAGERGVYMGRSGCYESLEEALNAAAVATKNTVVWNLTT
jgi:hypothetical protein